MSVDFSDFGNFTGIGNSTTPVIVVASPAANVRFRVDYIGVKNKDSGSITGKFQIKDGGTTYDIEEFTIAPAATWSAGELMNRYTLCTTAQQFQIVLTSSPGTQPDLYATWGIYL